MYIPPFVRAVRPRSGFWRTGKIPWMSSLRESLRYVETLSEASTVLVNVFSILLVYLKESTSFDLYKEERTVQCPVRPKCRRPRKGGEVRLRQQVIADGFDGGGAFSSCIEHQFCRVVALHRKERWAGFESFFVPGNKILHGWGGAVDKESVDEYGSVNRRVVHAGKVRRVPSVRA